MVKEKKKENGTRTKKNTPGFIAELARFITLSPPGPLALAPVVSHDERCDASPDPDA